MATYGPPEIFNSDQGCQFTSEGFTDVLKDHDVDISMDGKGRWMDNVFIERLWRSLKYEEIYLKAYDSVNQAKQGIGDWMNLAYPVCCQSYYRMSPLTAVEYLVGRCRGMYRNSQDRVECGHWIETPVEAEHKFVEISL